MQMVKTDITLVNSGKAAGIKISCLERLVAEFLHNDIAHIQFLPDTRKNSADLRLQLGRLSFVSFVFSS